MVDYERVKSVIERELMASPFTRGRIRDWPKLGTTIPPDAEPNARTIPAVRVEVAPGGPPRRLTTEGGVMRPATIVIRTWTAGPGEAEAIALWARIEAALDPSDVAARDALDDRLEAVGLWSLRIARPGLPAEGAIAGRVVEAAGTLTAMVAG